MSELTLTRRRKIEIALGALVLVLGALVFYLRRESSQGVDYHPVKVERATLSQTVIATGTVNPQNRLNIQSPIAGRAERVLVDQGDVVRKGQIVAWISSTERASLLDGARAEGPEETKKWEALYKPTPVLAPVRGMIIQRNIQPGQTFSTTDAILVMSDHLIVQAQVDETDIAQVKLGQSSVIVLDAYPGHTIKGRVEKIAYDAKTVNNVTTYAVDVLPDEVPAFMRSGMTANVTFPIGVRDGVLAIPSDAVKTKEGKPYVLVTAARGGQPERREVTMGLSDGKRVEIVAGLSEGELVLEPEFKLKGGPQGTSPFSPLGGKPKLGKGGH